MKYGITAGTEKISPAGLTVARAYRPTGSDDYYAEVLNELKKIISVNISSNNSPSSLLHIITIKQ